MSCGVWVKPLLVCNYGAVAYHHHCYSLELTMNAYSTANHTITFTINTIDDDEFLKTIEGQNYVRVERADIDGARHAQRKAQDLYLRKVLQVCEYCQRDSEVFCAAVKWEYIDNIGNTYEAGKFTI